MTTALLDPGLALKLSAVSESTEEIDEWETPIFAFHDLDYIPSGYGGILAPYIETGPGTMRAAATLMRLDLAPHRDIPSTPQVICDLGCGDGEFLIGLLSHINASTEDFPIIASSGLGIDYNASLIETAALNAVIAGEKAQWLVYDFNLDEHDLFEQMGKKGVTHVFVYLVPKQLALRTVRRLLVRLCESGVVICCHKFQPAYLEAKRSDALMDLVVYERALEL